MGLTLIFPGQGSQYTGMGQKYINEKESMDLFQAANNTLGFDLKKICLEGPDSELALTKYTQPAIVTYSILLFNKLKKVLDAKNIQIDRVLGHSVGEYSALVAAGAIKPLDAIKAVHYRGKFMQEAVPEAKGAMVAILRAPAEEVLKACNAVSTSESNVMPANFNEPLQTVISGHKEACDKAVEWLKENFKQKHMAIPLKVSAPFHSQLMKPAEINLSKYFSEIEFSENALPYIANINAKTFEAGTSGEQIKNNLIEQVCAGVQWSQSISSLPADSICIEVGPGKVLQGLNKKINSQIKTYNLDGDEGFAGLEEFLG